MTQSEIIEGNKTIAIFMGELCFDVNWPLEELRYHESWDWLIPVIQKIMNSHTSIRYNMDLFLLKGHFQSSMSIKLFHNNIIDIFKDVITFIDGYNMRTFVNLHHKI